MRVRRTVVFEYDETADYLEELESYKQEGYESALNNPIYGSFSDYRNMTILSDKKEEIA